MSTAPRVWVYTDVYPPAVAGGAYMAQTWVQQFRRQGFHVRVFRPSGTRDRWRTPDEVAFTTWKDVAYAGDLHARFSAIAEVRRAKDELPDIILVCSPGRVGMLGMATAQRYGVPLVMVYAADLVGAVEFYDARRAVLAVLSKVVGMAATSPPLRRRMLDLKSFMRDHDTPIADRPPLHLLRACQVGAASAIMLSRKRMDIVEKWAPDVPVHLIPSGIDRLPEAAAPPELTWRDGALRVVYVGRFAREKNLHPLVEALRLAKDDGVEVDLVLAGEGELKEELTKLAQEHGVADRFRTIGPFPRHELRGVYASAEVFVFASVSDTQGFVLNEAAHEGLALLVADAGVNPVVSEGESAYVVAPDARGFAEGFTALTDPELRAKMGERAQALARDLTEERQSAKLVDIMRRHVAGEPVTPIRS